MKIEGFKGRTGDVTFAKLWTSPVLPKYSQDISGFSWDSLSSTASSGGMSRFFQRNISRMETMGCKQAPHAVNSGTEIL